LTLKSPILVGFIKFGSQQERDLHKLEN